MPTSRVPHLLARRRPAVALLVAAVLLAGCTSSSDPTPSPQPTTASASASPDPRTHLAELAEPGRFLTQATSYTLPTLPVPGLAQPVEVEGDVVGPVDADGPLPLVLFLHGYQASCSRASDGSSTGDWPCPEGFEPIANRAGFEYLQERLASHGFLTVSIAGNGVNVQDTDMNQAAGADGRATLIHHHLDAWAAGGIEQVGSRWPEVDARSVLLVGHSRGGEGVDHAATQAPDDAAWTIRGEVLIAPTEFERPARGSVPVVAFSGDCDGDVGPGAGQRYVDRPADPAHLRSSVLLAGANHNFFNTEWDPATSAIKQGYDDAYLESGQIDPTCDPKGDHRLTAAQQQDVAMRVLTMAAAALLSEDQVAADALDGRTALPVGEPTVDVAALGRGRTTSMMTTGYTGVGSGSMTAVRCRGVSETERKRDCGRGTGMGTSVHWPDSYLDTVPRDYLELHWGKVSGTTDGSPVPDASAAEQVTLTLAGPMDLSAADGVEARIALAADSSPVSFDVGLTDGEGRSAVLAANGPLRVLPGGPLLPPRRWGQRIFAELPGAPGDPGRAAALGGLDPTRIVKVALIPRSDDGHAWIIDLSALPHR